MRDSDLFDLFLVDVYTFFYHALPDESELPSGSALSLEELHELVKDVWISRHDADIEQEKSNRRKGRPKSTKEVKLEEERARDVETYRTGMGENLSRVILFHVTDAKIGHRSSRSNASTQHHPPPTMGWC